MSDSSKTHWSRWAEEELDVLAKLYPSGDKEALLNELPGRTWNSIRGQAQRRGIAVENARGQLGSIHSAPAERSPTVADIHWVTGFYEGEGTCALANTEMVNVSQKTREPLDKLKEILGGHVGLRSTGRKHDIYVYSATGPRARGLLMTIYPLLSRRRQAQARRAMSWMT